jgi:hypothetical protein
VLSRLRKDAVGWEAPAPQPLGKRGPKPRSGRKWTWATLLARARPTRERLTRYGTLTEVVFVVRDVGLRDVAQKVRGVVLEGTTEPILLLRTVLTRSPVQSIAIYAARFSLELTIRDLQQHCGLGDSQWTTLAMRRFVHLACLAFCRWRLALLEHLEAGWLRVTSARVSLPEAPLSFPRVRRALRAGATRQIIVANATPGADRAKIERDHELLLHMLV